MFDIIYIIIYILFRDDEITHLGVNLWKLNTWQDFIWNVTGGGLDADLSVHDCTFLTVEKTFMLHLLEMLESR